MEELKQKMKQIYKDYLEKDLFLENLIKECISMSREKNEDNEYAYKIDEIVEELKQKYSFNW